MMKMLRSMRGFSLLEMALVLATLAFLMVLVFSLSSTVNTMQAVVPSEDAVQRGENALAGFVVMNDRLPCPDTAGLGVENCGGAKYGGFPWKTVGLAQPLKNAHGFDLEYGVYRNATADLADNTTSAYSPSFLYLSLAAIPAPAAEWNTPVPTAYTVNKNGLDFCEKLRTGAKAGYAGTEISTKTMFAPATMVNPAFLLADPGYTDADSSGGQFDAGNNTGTVWESPGRPKSLGYDDQVAATSFNQLSARLSCPAIIARVSAAVRDANAAADIKRTYDFLVAMRDRDKQIADAAAQLADVQLAIAIFDVALNAAMSALDIGITLGSASGAVAGAIAIVNGVIAIGMSVTGLVLAGTNNSSAHQAVTDAITKLGNANTAAAIAGTNFTSAIDDAKARDAKGWFQ